MLGKLWKIGCLLTGFCWLYGQKQDSVSLELESFILLDSSSTLQADFEDKEQYSLQDSMSTPTTSNNSLAQSLLFQTPLNLRLQSPSGLASSGVSGGKANHTAVVWNGFKIDAPTLGMTDLSLISPYMFNQVQIAMDPNGSVYGSGALNAIIHLNQQAQFYKHLDISSTFQYSTLPLANVNTQLRAGGKGYSSSTFLRYARGQQNYAYPLTHRKLLPHNDLENLQLSQDLFFKTGSKSYIHLSYWGLANTQFLPPTDLVLESHAYQEDAQHQISGRYRNLGKHAWSIGGFYKNANTFYEDSTKGISSSNPYQIAVLQGEVKLLNYHDYHLHLIAQADYAWTNSENLGGKVSQLNLRLNLSDQWQFHPKLMLQTGVGINYQAPLWIPSFYSHLKSKINKKISNVLGVSTNFRSPSFNERYWQPGGNPDLKPEQGYSIFNTWNFNLLAKEQQSLNLQYTFRYRQTKDLIIWVPTGQFTTGPQNIQEQKYIGNNLKFSYSMQRKRIQLKTSIFGSYRWSTVVHYNSTDTPKNYYLPSFTFGGQLALSVYQIQLTLENRSQTEMYYTDLDLIPFFSVSNIHLSYPLQIKQYRLTFSGSVQNIFNQVYRYMPMYYMPLRNYQLSINIQFRNYEKNN